LQAVERCAPARRPLHRGFAWTVAVGTPAADDARVVLHKVLQVVGQLLLEAHGRLGQLPGRGPGRPAGAETDRTGQARLVAVVREGRVLRPRGEDDQVTRIGVQGDEARD